MKMPNKLDSSESRISSILQNLKINNGIVSSNEQTSNNSDNPDSTETNTINLSEYRAKYKTIKIFVASNKNEFEIESKCLLEETLPELQQYFLQFGYDFLFVDVNLNYDYDPFVDPYLFECLKKEIDDCYRTSDGCFFITLIGNKYGSTPLPLEISQNDFESFRVSLSSSDLEFLQSWYILDEKFTPPAYKLRSLIDAFPNFYNKNPDNYESHINEKMRFLDVHRKLIEIIQNAISNHEFNSSKHDNKPLNNSIKTKNNSQNDLSYYQYSGLELLTHFAFKNSLNESIAICRTIENLDSTKKSAEKYTDLLSNGKIDKQKDEKQHKYKEAVLMRLGAENKHEFTIKWNDSAEDIVEILTKHSNASSETEDSNTNSLTPSSTPLAFQKYDIDFRNYIHNFNAIIVSKIKSLVEKHLQEEIQISSKPNEIKIFQEIARHHFKFKQLSEREIIESSEYLERFKRLLTLGSKSDHYPIFLYGAGLSGKSSLITKFGFNAHKLIDSQNCYLLVRFFDLTSQCSTFEGLIYSICEQLNLLQNLNASNEIENKDINQLIEYFLKVCHNISKANKNSLLILIDGLQDINVEKLYLNKSNTSNNQISWLFEQQLPPRVHLIVSIKRQSSLITRTENTDNILQTKNYQNHPLAQMNCHAAVASTATLTNLSTQPSISVPLLLYYFNEKLSSETENHLFELPISMRKTDTSDLNTYFKNELAKHDRSLNEDLIQAIVQFIYNHKSIENNSSNNLLVPNHMSTSSSPVADHHQSPYLYINYIINEIISVNTTNSDFHIDSSLGRFPKDLESYFKYKIETIEKKFNLKMISCIFNYITAAHNGITEMELIDLLSCNNEFFSEYYSNTELPSMLRFPINLWILVKHQLGSLLSLKYMDNKVTYFWSQDWVKKMMKQRYFNKVDQIRTCHKDIANYFLESFVETKPLVDMNKNMQIRDEEGRRFICQQPLLYSEVKYNYRRMSELWYHLMNSGDIQRLKEHAFFNFEHLLAKCHGMSLQVLLNDLEAVLRRILDIDILLLSSLLKKSVLTLSQDPLRLSSEILTRLRPLQNEYGEHVKSLVSQASYWCENHDSPVLVPLTTWLESPENLLITRIDHSEGIFKIAVTSFNQHVFFSTSKHEICMYHIPSKKLVRKFNGHTDVINCLQITYNNRYLISGSSDKLMRVWNLGTGEIENTFTNHKSAILCSVITHSDELIVTGTYDRLINVIRIENGDIVHSIEKHFDAVTALALSLDDTILVSASTDKTVRRWWFEDMQILDNIATIYSSVTCMNITCDNTFVIIGCENKTVQVKSLITGTDIHDLSGHNSDITCLASSYDCERIYVACSDAKLYLYDVKSRELIAILIEQESSINDLRISADNSFLFSSSGNSLYVLNLKKKKFISRQKSKELEQNRLIKSIAISKEGDMAITGDESGQVALWNLQTGDFLETLIEPSTDSQRYGVCKLALSNSHLFSVVGFTDNTVNVFDNEMGDIVAEFVEHQSQVKHLYILDDNRRILTSDGFNLCKIWLAHTGQLLESITVACNLLALSPDMKHVVSGPGENVAKIWGLNEAKVIRSIDHPNKITVIRFTHDSQFVITGGEDNSCKIWELLTGKLIQVLIEHDGAITSIAVPFNNNLVVSGAKDKLVLLWNFKDGSVIHKLISHQDIIVTVAITFDGNIVVSGSKDGVINVWSSRYGTLLTSLNLQFTLADLLMSTDGTRMIARFCDSTTVPIIALTHKTPPDYNRTMSQSSLKSFDYITKSHGGCLPIKPKPLVFAKKSTNLLKLFTQEAEKLKENEKKTTRRPSEFTGTIQAEPISVSQHSSRGIFQKQKRKTKKSSEFSSNASMVNKEEKQRKTKICCLL